MIFISKGLLFTFSSIPQKGPFFARHIIIFHVFQKQQNCIQFGASTVNYVLSRSVANLSSAKESSTFGHWWNWPPGFYASHLRHGKMQTFPFTPACFLGSSCVERETNPSHCHRRRCFDLRYGSLWVLPLCLRYRIPLKLSMATLSSQKATLLALPFLLVGKR